MIERREPLSWRHPPREPFRSGRLTVSRDHSLYFEESGNPEGRPILFVHGGPGGACEEKHRQYFDPVAYRAILFDQRGCGRSTPFGITQENTTSDLISDMERLRDHIGIKQWHLFGGSWGSTLSLAYAQAHPERVSALILRGIFLFRQRELAWFYQDGANRIFPDAWEPFEEHIPPGERADLLSAYYQRLMANDETICLPAARHWLQWEMAISRFCPSELLGPETPDLTQLAIARIGAHYAIHRGFLKSDTQLLDGVDRIRHIPCAIVQGRYDLVCPMDCAWSLHKAWPEAEFLILWDAGHSAGEPSMCRALVAITDRFAFL